MQIFISIFVFVFVFVYVVSEPTTIYFNIYMLLKLVFLLLQNWHNWTAVHSRLLHQPQMVFISRNIFLPWEQFLSMLYSLYCSFKSPFDIFQGMMDAWTTRTWMTCHYLMGYTRIFCQIIWTIWKVLKTLHIIYIEVPTDVLRQLWSPQLAFTNALGPFQVF